MASHFVQVARQWLIRNVRFRTLVSHSPQPTKSMHGLHTLKYLPCHRTIMTLVKRCPSPRRSSVRWACYAGLLSTFGLAEEDSRMKDTRRYIEDAVIRAMQCQKELGDAKAAEAQLHLALKMAQETMDEEAVTYIFDSLANLALETGRLDDAEKLFVETAKRLVQSGTPTDDESMLEISIKLADVYSSTGRKDEAEIGYRYCLDCLEKKMDSMHGSDPESEDNTRMLWAMSSDAYARFLMSVERYVEARSHFQRALDVCRRINGPTHPQTLVLVNNVGGAAYMVGDYDDAVDQLRTAANIAAVTESTDLAAYYRNLGVVLIHMRRFDEASTACRKALDVAVATKDRESERHANDCLQTARNEREPMSV